MAETRESIRVAEAPRQIPTLAHATRFGDMPLGVLVFEIFLNGASRTFVTNFQQRFEQFLQPGSRFSGDADHGNQVAGGHCLYRQAIDLLVGR